MKAPTAPAAKPEASGSSAILDPAPMSMIDAAWGFDPASERYALSLYRPNYLKLARYSSRPNEAPFDVLFDALDNPEAETGLHRGRVPDQLQGPPVDDG